MIRKSIESGFEFNYMIFYTVSITQKRTEKDVDESSESRSSEDNWMAQTRSKANEDTGRCSVQCVAEKCGCDRTFVQLWDTNVFPLYRAP